MVTPSPEQLADMFEAVGSRGLRLVTGKALGPGLVTDLPAANAAYRNLQLSVAGGTGVADQTYLCRKNADDTYEWVPLGTTTRTLVLLKDQSWDDALNPDVFLGTSTGRDADVKTGLVDLQGYSQGRLRWELTGAASAGVTGTVEYSELGSVWTSLLANTADLTDTSGETEWEDLAAGVMGETIRVGLRFALAGAGVNTYDITVLLDLRG